MRGAHARSAWLHSGWATLCVLLPPCVPKQRSGDLKLPPCVPKQEIIHANDYDDDDDDGGDDGDGNHRGDRLPNRSGRPRTCRALTVL